MQPITGLLLLTFLSLKYVVYADEELSNYPDETQEKKEGKRYLGALAKSGRLPYNPVRQSEPEVYKRYLAALVNRHNKMRFSQGSEPDKRNIAAMAKNNRLPGPVSPPDQSTDSPMEQLDMQSENELDKRYIGALMKNGRMPIFASEGKRNLAALAKNGRLPFSHNDEDMSNVDKRYVAALVKNGRLRPAEGKRYVAALIKNGRMPRVPELMEETAQNQDLHEPEDEDMGGSYAEGNDEVLNPDQLDKRNIASLARKGWLKQSRSYRSPNSNAYSSRTFSRFPVYGGIKRDLYYMSGGSDQERPEVSKSGNDECNEESEDDVPEGEDPNHFDDKRNIAAMAKNGRLPSLRPAEYWSYKRNPGSKFNRMFWPAAPVMFGPYTGANQADRPRQLKFVKIKSKRCKKSVSTEAKSKSVTDTTVIPPVTV